MFRLKIALLSVLISGSVLMVFGLFFMTVFSRVGLDRIDREILTLGESQLHVWHPRKHWEAFDRSLRFIYGPERWKDLIVQVAGADDRVLFRSPHWPDGITIASFPGFVPGRPPRPEMAPRLPEGPANPPKPPTAQRDETDGKPPVRPTEGQDRPGQATGLPVWPPPPPLGRPEIMEVKDPVFMTLETPQASWRTGIMGNQRLTIILGINMNNFHKDADRFKKTFLFSVPLALLLLAGGGWLLAHRALKPVALITRTAEKITARGLDQRIPATGADSELLHLIKVINDMLDRLEKSFGQAVRFSADAAHELQTPLTILQGILDDAVRHAPPDTDEQERYGNLLEEVQRLKSIVRKLLILARADAGKLLPRLETVDLSTMIESAVEDAGVLGPYLIIEKRISPGIATRADPDLLRLVIQGLTTNAVKYNTRDGLIRFELDQRGNQVFISISNTGPSIPEKERERIFGRFYRLDKSRSRHVPGMGLGLSLAREIVRAHGGDLYLDPNKNYANSFTVKLPLDLG